MTSPILQDRLPFDPAAPRPLPGVAPLDPADWLLVDEAFAGQMALRDHLLATRRADVLRLDAAARPAAEELYDTVLDHLSRQPDYDVGAGDVRRPDGVRVTLDRGDPLATLGRLVQEDLCLMELRGTEHVLTGAVLCFPANWRLDEKFLRPLTAIHRPVAAYDADLARRVQRLFHGVRPGRPLWRFNALGYFDPSLFQPKSESGPHREDRGGAPYLRCERQCVLRLPESGAAVFSIHTYMLARPRGAEAGQGGVT